MEEDSNPVGRQFECRDCGLKSLEFPRQSNPTFWPKKCFLCFGDFVEQHSSQALDAHQAVDEVRPSKDSRFRKSEIFLIAVVPILY
jgi:hypothetical protein